MRNLRKNGKLLPKISPYGGDAPKGQRGDKPKAYFAIFIGIYFSPLTPTPLP